MHLGEIVTKKATWQFLSKPTQKILRSTQRKKIKFLFHLALNNLWMHVGMDS